MAESEPSSGENDAFVPRSSAAIIRTEKSGKVQDVRSGSAIGTWFNRIVSELTNLVDEREGSTSGWKQKINASALRTAIN